MICRPHVVYNVLQIIYNEIRFSIAWAFSKMVKPSNYVAKNRLCQKRATLLKTTLNNRLCRKYVTAAKLSNYVGNKRLYQKQANL